MGKKRRTRDKLLERLAAPALALSVLAFWQLAVPLFGLSEFVLPTPLSIAHRMVSDFRLLATQATYTLYEVVAGFVLAVGIGIPLSLGVFYWKSFERAVYPMLVALQTIPKVALAPLLVLYLGYGWAPKICLVFLISFFPIVISTVVGLNSLEKGFVNLVRSMGANEWQTFIKVRLPAALPSVFGGFKVAISLAVIGAIIGEYVASSQGLGYVQLQSNARFDTTLNFATVVTISLMGVILYFVLSYVEARFVYQREAAK
jgi:NitT/TauT family transport system permease protein